MGKDVSSKYSLALDYASSGRRRHRQKRQEGILCERPFRLLLYTVPFSPRSPRVVDWKVCYCCSFSPFNVKIHNFNSRITHRNVPKEKIAKFERRNSNLAFEKSCLSNGVFPCFSWRWVICGIATCSCSSSTLQARQRWLRGCREKNGREKKKGTSPS